MRADPTNVLQLCCVCTKPVSYDLVTAINFLLLQLHTAHAMKFTLLMLKRSSLLFYCAIKATPISVSLTRTSVKAALAADSIFLMCERSSYVTKYWCYLYDIGSHIRMCTK